MAIESSFITTRWLASSAAIVLAVLLLVATGRGEARSPKADEPNSSNAAETPAQPDPPFPRMFGVDQIGLLKIHIVSESVSDKQGYETTEEFLDLYAGRETFIVTSRRGHSVVHIDAMANVVYNYKPYYCMAMKPGELELGGYGGLWSTENGVKFKALDGTNMQMHVYGVAALWFNAGNLPKTYAPAKVIYSGSKDIYRPARQWTVRWEPTKELYRFYFIESRDDSSSSAASNETPTLEMIEIESLETGQVTKRLNILSYEYEIADEVYDNLLQVPVGYGCVDDAARELSEVKYPMVDDLYMPSALQNGAHKIDLEVTATKFERLSSGGETRRSDTINVELARSRLMEKNAASAVQLVRQRDTKADIKTILNYLYNVQYKIDLRKGTCEMSNMGKQRSPWAEEVHAESADEPDERAVLEFSNDLKLTIDVVTMRELFIEYKDYHFVKRTNTGPGKMEVVFYEKASKTLRPGKLSRIVRRYLNVDQHQERLMLDSVTIWVIDDNKERILESYHLNVVDIISLSDDQHRAKIFDVSEECYLNNDQMRAGRDYAWFELSYPASSVQLEQLASDAGQIKTRVYTQLENEYINFFRVPRVEVMFESTAFTVRILMLDNPPLQLVYDAIEKTTFELNKNDGDLEDMAMDLEHCTDLCRLNQCKMMTFCYGNHLCLLSRGRMDGPAKNRKPMALPHCTTYTQPPADKDVVKEVFEMSLHRVLGQLRHQDYSPVALPKRPDELIYPRSETGIDQETYEDIKRQYQFKVMQFINMDMDKQPILNYLALELDGNEWTIVTPNRFELEQDPLAEFEPSDSDDQDDEGDGGGLIPMAFHEGISMRRFKINTLNDDIIQKRNARLFMGLGYDQCALACADSRCSSFSYCAHREECIITDIYNIGAFVENSTETDVDCHIAQRDFLSKFNRFADVYRPVFYKSQVMAWNPSECAHSCMVASDFNCLAFDFCELPVTTTSQSTPGNCFLLQERNLFTGADSVVEQYASGKTNYGSKISGKPSGCDHYSRSYLADFVRIEYRRLESEVLGKLKSSLVQGRSVDRCAEICANELMDCTAFQFCFDPEADGAKQSCTMIESKPQGGKAADYQVVLDQSADGRITKAGTAFRPDAKCHVFSLRQDSSEARQRDLALSTADSNAANGNKQTKTNGAGLSIWGAILLYFCMALTFAGLGCGFVVAKHRSEFVREKVERVRLLLGLRA